MSKKAPKSLSELIGTPGGELAALAAQARARLDLADDLRKILPPDLRPALTGCNLRSDGTLVVTTDSPAWAARLRFESEGLLRACQGRFPETARVRVRVVSGTAGSR